MIHIAFCDDDERFLQSIVRETRKIFKHVEDKIQINMFTSGSELVADFRSRPYFFNAVFLSTMAAQNGKEIAENLRKLNKSFWLFFMSSRGSEMIDIFRYDVVGFLSKNRVSEQLPCLLNCLVHFYKKNGHNKVFRVESEQVPHRNELIKIALEKIVYFESQNRKVYLHTEKARYLLHNYKFSDLVMHYKGLGFADIHRTCLVNPAFIKEMNDLQVVLDTGILLPLSRRKKQKIADCFCHFYKNENEKWSPEPFGF